MRYYLFIFAAVVLLALQFSTNKAYGQRRGDGARASLIFLTVTSYFSSVLTFLVTLFFEGGFRVTWFSLLMSGVMAALSCAYTVIGFKIMSIGDMSVFMMFLMLGGMLLPYLFGVFLLDEVVSVWRVIGVILLAVSMAFPVLARRKGGKTGVLFVVLCLTVFVLNGLASVVTKTHQVNLFDMDIVNPPSYACLGNFMNGTISLVCLLVLRLKNIGHTGTADNDAEPPCADGSPVSAEKAAAAREPAKALIHAAPAAIFVLMLANAMCNSVSYTLQLVSAVKLPASVMYPMLTGGTVVLSAVAGFVLFREKPDRISLMGLLLSFAATFLFLF